MKTNKILVIAAHPDDEILGCGGTIARYINEGWEAYTLILGEGITARDVKRDRIKRETEIQLLKKKAQLANKIIGIRKIYFHNFPDNRFDSIPLLDLVKLIEKVKKEIQPDIIFTHNEYDLNIDHRLTYQAVLTATRPIRGERIKEIYSFEILSSSEWNFSKVFIPDVYIDIEKSLNTKIKSLKEYSTELRKYPHPRSIKGVQLLSQIRGMQAGLIYAEAFKSIRIIK